MEKAREAGVRIGRPPSGKEAEIEKLFLAGWPASRIRKELKCGTDTVARVVRRIKSERA